MTASPSSPLKRALSIVSSNENSIMGQIRSQTLKKLEVDALIRKFMDFSNSIEVNPDQANFNLIEYERENDKIKYDPQMMAAKLRKLENRAEINRAQMEIDNRLKKKMKKLGSKKDRPPEESYKIIYDKFIKNRKMSDVFDDISDDESHHSENEAKNVAFFSQLKRHPRILEYTLEKIESKERSRQPLDSSRQTSQNLKPAEMSQEYKDLLEEVIKKNNQSPDHNPESILEGKFNKFFTKKSSDNIKKEIRDIPRCSKMIRQQNEILSSIDDKSLSKDNKKKLKSRLNEIIFSISKSERVHHNSTHTSFGGTGASGSGGAGASSGGFALPKISSLRGKSQYAVSK